MSILVIERRSAEEVQAYLQGFAAAARMLLDYQRKGKTADECEEFINLVCQPDGDTT